MPDDIPHTPKDNLTTQEKKSFSNTSENSHSENKASKTDDPLIKAMTSFLRKKRSTNFFDQNIKNNLHKKLEKSKEEENTKPTPNPP